MKKITLQQFWDSEEELAIHVRSEEEANKLCKAFHKLGKKWCDGDSYLNINNYEIYKEATSYDNNGYFATRRYYTTVYEFDEVKLDNFKLTLQEFFESRKMLVIHVSSEKEAKTLCEAMARMGKSWKGGKSCVEDTKYERFKEETCYTNTMQFCDKATFENLGYNIYELDDVDLKINLKKDAELSD